MKDRSHITPAIRREALAFRIWAFCKPLDWNVTLDQVASELDVHRNSVIAAAKSKGWLGLFRRQCLDSYFEKDRLGPERLRVLDVTADSESDSAIIKSVS